MVSGFLTPSDARDFTHPEGLREEIRKAVPKYEIYVPLPRSGAFSDPKDGFDFLNRVHEQTRRRIEAFRYLDRTYAPPFHMAVFMAMDQVQHLFWKYVDPTQERFYGSYLGERVRNHVTRIYAMLDVFLGELLGQLDDQTTLIVVSDHGFGPQQRNFLVNRWLRDQGLLSIRSKSILLHRALRRFGFDRQRRGKPFQGTSPAVEDRFVNWARTRAYGSHPSEQAIYVNLKGREPRGIVEPDRYEDIRNEIRQRLREIRDERGEPIVDRIITREETYSGPYVDLAPDLYVKIQNYSCMLSPRLDARVPGYFQDVDLPAGCHRENGVLMAAGAGIREGALARDAQIADVAPTILHLMGCPVPGDMDGRVLDEVLDSSFLEAHPVQRTRTAETETESKDRQDYSEEQKKELEDKLKGLGYL
jgi:predicted AlkP superfamily phosphohydrolase/phosphomutase